MLQNILSVSLLLTITFELDILIEERSLALSFLSHYQLLTFSMSPCLFREEICQFFFHELLLFL